MVVRLRSILKLDQVDFDVPRRNLGDVEPTEVCDASGTGCDGGLKARPQPNDEGIGVGFVTTELVF